MSMYMVHKKYIGVSSLNDDVDEVIKLVNSGEKEKAIEKLEEINSEINFMNSFFFDKDVEAID